MSATVVSLALSTVAVLFLGSDAADAQGTDTQPNPAHLSYDCHYPGTTSQSIVADIGWTAGGGVGSGLDSALALTTASVTLSAPMVDQLRSLGTATLGGVFGPVLTPIAPGGTDPLALAPLISLPKQAGSRFALVGAWVASQPTFPFASGSSYTLSAPSFTLQLAADKADGSAVSLPASATCSATTGVVGNSNPSNVVFAHTPRVCAPSETPAPPDGGNVCAPSPATPTPTATVLAPTTSPAAPTSSPTPKPTAKPSPTASATPSPSPTPVATPAANHVDYLLSGLFGLPSVSGTGRVGPGSIGVDTNPQGPAAGGDLSYTGSLQLPTVSIQGNLFGFVPITVIADVHQSGPLSGSLSPDQSASADLMAKISLKSVNLLGILPLTTGSCHTVADTSLHLTSGGAHSFDATVGGDLSGTFTLGAFTDCGPVTPFVNQLISGSGNTVSFTVTRA